MEYEGLTRQMNIQIAMAADEGVSSFVEANPTAAHHAPAMRAAILGARVSLRGDHHDIARRAMFASKTESSMTKKSKG
jgi:hypothetical protein